MQNGHLKLAILENALISLHKENMKSHYADNTIERVAVTTHVPSTQNSWVKRYMKYRSYCSISI